MGWGWDRGRGQAPKRARASCGISGLSARALICCTAQVLPSGSAKPKNVPPSRSSNTVISLALHAPPDQFLPGRPRRRRRRAAGPASNPGAISRLRGQVADDDRAAGSAGGELGDVHVLVAGVVVERETDLVAVERDRPVDVADREQNDLEGPVHGASPFGRVARRRVPAATSEVGSGQQLRRAARSPRPCRSPCRWRPCRRGLRRTGRRCGRAAGCGRRRGPRRSSTRSRPRPGSPRTRRSGWRTRSRGPCGRRRGSAYSLALAVAVDVAVAAAGGEVAALDVHLVAVGPSHCLTRSGSGGRGRRPRRARRTRARCR